VSGERWHRGMIENADYKTWRSVNESILPEEKRKKYISNKLAVEMYISGSTYSEIERVTGVKSTSLIRMLKRCMAISSDGFQWGYRALIPHERVTKYKRRSTVSCKPREARGGMAGALGALLERFPDIDVELIDQVLKLKKSAKIYENKISSVILHRVFLSILREKGVRDTEWPFNTKQLGKKSIQTYMKSVLDNNFNRGVRARGNNTAKAHLPLGGNEESLMVFNEPYDAVEIDAYKIDAFMSVYFDTPEGTKVPVRLDRLWLVAAIDRASTCILSYEVVYSSEVSSRNVLNVIWKAANSNPEVELTIPGLTYFADGGLILPRFNGHFFTQQKVSNASL